MTATTTAIAMPAVLLLMALVVQAGLYHHARQRAAAAADEAVAAARVPGGTPADGADAARLFLDRAPLDQPDVDVSRGDDLTAATVTGWAPRLIPGIAWRVEASASAPTERFVPEDERQ